MTELVFPELRRDPLARGAVRGVLVCWLVNDGREVTVGDRLAEVRDAAAASGWVRALATGTLWHQAQAGEVVPVGTVIGLIE